MKEPNRFTGAYDPCEFEQGDIIKSIFSKNIYELIEKDNRGMARLREMSSGIITTWSAYGNAHFLKQKSQLTLFTRFPKRDKN